MQGRTVLKTEISVDENCLNSNSRSGRKASVSVGNVLNYTKTCFQITIEKLWLGMITEEHCCESDPTMRNIKVQFRLNKAEFYG